MRWLAAARSGALAGTTILVGLYLTVISVLWIRSAGKADPVMTTLLASHGDALVRALLRFGALHILAGTALGIVSGLLVELLIKPRPGSARFSACLGGVTATFLYLNLRYLVMKPALYDPIFNAHGGLPAGFQNLITDSLSPHGADLLFIAVAAAAMLLSTRRRKNRKPEPEGGAPAKALCAAIPLAILAGAGFLGSMALAPGSSGASGPSREGLSRTGGSGATLERPNILIVGSDSLRPDHLSFNGYGRTTSPRIDRLAAESAVFADAQVPLARTLPSWASLLTSVHPHTHGFRHMFPEPRKRKIRNPLLTRILAEAGYRSAVVSDYAGECFDLVDMGFDERDVPPTTSLDIVVERELLIRLPHLAPFFDHAAGHRLLPLLRFLMTNPDADALTERVLDRLRALDASGSPFLLTAFYSCTHIPYAVAWPGYRRFTDPHYRGIHKYGYGVSDVRDIEAILDRPEPAAIRQIEALYDGGVFAFDRSVDRILEEVDRLGIADRTVVIILSDHGENIYDGDNLLEHGDRFGGGDAANRIPLILHDPAGRIAPGPVTAPVSSLDLMPTLLARLELPVPEGVEGRDLAPLTRGAAPGPRRFFAETGLWLTGTPEAFSRFGPSLPVPAREPPSRSGGRHHRAGPAFRGAFPARQAATGLGRPVQADLRAEARGGRSSGSNDTVRDPANERDLAGDPDHAATLGTLKRALWEWMRSAPGIDLDTRPAPGAALHFFRVTGRNLVAGRRQPAHRRSVPTPYPEPCP